MFEAIEDIDSFLTQLLLGDDEAWRTLRAEGQRDLIRVYIRMGFSESEAKELWDRTVIKLFLVALAKYDPKKGHLDQWVKRVACNLGLDEWRRRKRKNERPLDSLSLSELRKSVSTELSSECCAHATGYCTCPEQKEGGKPELNSLVGSALSSLSESDQNVLLKRYVEIQPFDLIAESFGISEPAARMRDYRARKKFKVEIERLCPGEQRRRIKRLRR
jgi:RNA polymerase sigma factor (sigma-70 family)